MSMIPSWARTLALGPHCGVISQLYDLTFRAVPPRRVLFSFIHRGASSRAPFLSRTVSQTLPSISRSSPTPRAFSRVPVWLLARLADTLITDVTPRTPYSPRQQAPRDHCLKVNLLPWRQGRQLKCSRWLRCWLQAFCFKGWPIFYPPLPPPPYHPHFSPNSHSDADPTTLARAHSQGKGKRGHLPLEHNHVKRGSKKSL